MRRKATIGLAAIAGVAFVAYLLVDRYFPWLFASDPNPPALVDPPDCAVLPNGHGSPALPFVWEFTWSEVPRADRYEVVVDNAANPKLGNKTEVDKPRHSATFSAISFDTLEGWSWKVRVEVHGRWSQWSESSAFRLEPPQKNKRPPWHVVLWLPRFDGKMIDGKWSPTHEEVQQAVKDLPCLPVNVTSYGDNNGRRMFQFPLVPTATSDLGDVVKALSKLGGDKKKPVATLNLAARVVLFGPDAPAEDAKFAVIKKELAEAKGFDWENSNRTGLALDETGGAKFLEIRAAYQKAGITLVDNLDDSEAKKKIHLPKGPAPRFFTVTEIGDDNIKFTELAIKDGRRVIIDYVPTLVEKEIYDAGGKKITAEQCRKRVKLGTVVLVSSDENMPDPAYLAVLKEDAIVVVSGSVLANGEPIKPKK